MRTCIFVVALALLSGVAAHAQRGNYLVDPDTYLALTSPDFPARVDFPDLSSQGSVMAATTRSTTG